MIYIVTIAGLVLLAFGLRCLMKAADQLDERRADY